MYIYNAMHAIGNWKKEWFIFEMFFFQSHGALQSLVFAPHRKRCLFQNYTYPIYWLFERNYTNSVGINSVDWNSARSFNRIWEAKSDFFGEENELNQVFFEISFLTASCGVLEENACYSGKRTTSKVLVRPTIPRKRFNMNQKHCLNYKLMNEKNSQLNIHCLSQIWSPTWILHRCRK